MTSAHVRGQHDYGVKELSTSQLERARRELTAQLKLIQPYTPARVPIESELEAVTAELKGRAQSDPFMCRELSLDQLYRVGVVLTKKLENCEPDERARLEAHRAAVDAEIARKEALYRPSVTR